MKNKVLRKALAVSLAAAMMFGTGFTAAGQFVGTGVSVSAASVEEVPEGYTGIYDIDDLYAIRSNPTGKFILMNDIDLSATRKDGDWDGGNGWMIIPSFSGELNGNGHKISNMHIFGNINRVGFIDELYGTVVDLHFTDVDIDVNYTGTNYVFYCGAICSYLGYSGSGSSASAGVVSRCSVSGKINVTSKTSTIYAGGLVGYSHGYYNSNNTKYSKDAVIKESYNKADITVSVDSQTNSKTHDIGGICGYLYETKIENCYNNGNVKSNHTGDYIGGLVGYIGSYCSVSTSLNLKDGAVYGYANSSYDVEDCYYLADNTFGDASTSCTALRPALIKKKGSYVNWDFNSIWEITPDESHPQLQNNREMELNAVESIAINKAPSKTQYAKGDKIVADGSILVSYISGDVEVVNITEDMLSGYDMSKTGEQTVTVTYNDVTTSYKITVTDNAVDTVNVLAISQAPSKTTYNKGESITADGQLLVVYTSGKVEYVNITKSMLSGYDMNKAGEQTVTVTYGGKTTSYKITVNESVTVDTISSVSIYQNPSKTTYTKGDSIVADGQLKVSYISGKTEYVNITKSMLSGYDMNKVGEQTVTVTYSGKTTSYKITVKDAETPTSYFTYIVNDDNTVNIIKYEGDEEEVVIPSTIGGKKVVEISYDPDTNEGAFEKNESVRKITVPEGVNKIGKYAFWCCPALESVVLPKTLTIIDAESFNGCENLKSVNIPNGTLVIGTRAFSYCTSLTQISLPDSVQLMGDKVFLHCEALKTVRLGSQIPFIADYTFAYCTALENISLPSSVTEIGVFAFAFCENLTNINIPSGVTDIYEGAFGASGLESVVIPNGVKEITRMSFLGTYLTTVTIPDSVTSIGEQAFSYCAELEKAYIPKSVTSIDDTAFDNCDALKIYGEKGSYAETYAKEKGIEFVANASSLANKSTISAESIKLGDTVKVTCAASGGTGSYKYNVLYKQTSQTSWTTAQSYGTNSVVTFKPAKATSYDVCVKVKDGSGTEVKKYFTVKVTQAAAELSNTSTLSSASVKLGDTVTVKCSAAGGTGTYQYNVLYKQTSQSKWTTAQSYKANATVSFKPGSATTYDVCVKVKDSSGTESKKYFTLKVTQAAAELSNTSTLSSASVKLGDTVTVKCSAAGGTGTYQYNVLYKQTSQSKWTTAQSYKANATVSFKPGSATTYDVCVKVKDSSGKEVKKYFTVKVEKAANELSNISTVSATSIKLGETVTVTANGSGSSGFYLYAVYYKKTSDTKWTTQQNFGSNAKISFKPAEAVSYDICVKVKDDKGSIAKKYFTITVSSQSGLTNTSTISADTIKLGNSVTVECSAKGSTGFYQYAVYYKKTSESKWTTVQGYSSNYTVSVKPGSATTYDICVKVKDNVGNESKKYFKVTVK